MALLGFIVRKHLIKTLDMTMGKQYDDWVDTFEEKNA